MGIFIFNDASTIRAVKCDNIVRLALEERELPDDAVSLRLSASFSPTTRSSNELGAFSKTVVDKKDSKAVSDLKALHLNLLDLIAGGTEIVNITDLEYPRKPKPKSTCTSTPKTKKPAPEGSETTEE